MWPVVTLLLFMILVLSVIDEGSSRPAQEDSELEENSKQNEIAFESDKVEAVESSDEKEYRENYAKKMMTFMNQSVDPCEDFYEYACGNWKNVVEERQAQHKRSNLLDIVYKLEDVVEYLLQQPAQHFAPEFADEWKLTQQFYQSCIEADLHPMKRSQEYLEVIKSIGGFPAVDGGMWDADNFSWFNMSSHLSNYGIAALINEEILPQYPFLPYFKLPDLGFDYIVRTDNIASNTSRGFTLNENRMRGYLHTYGVDDSNATQVIADVFKFWRAVLEVIDRFDEDWETCKILSLDTQSFDQWDNYYSIAWMGINFMQTEETNPCDFFYVELDKICAEQKEAVGNYLAMKFLYHMDARLKKPEFQKEYCLITIQRHLPYLLDKYYLKEYFNDNIREEITTIVREIRKSLRSILEDADWLDESTRKEALLKESTIVSRIGYFEDLELTQRLIEEMRNLTFTEGNFDLNNINLKKFKMFLRRYNGLHNDQIDNSTKPLELLLAMQVNAFYYNVDNSINVMAGILHPPAYHKAWPNSLKFGTIGYLVGHEFTHGFDTVGALFDSTGDERYWWSKKSGKVFEERADCYVNHYNSYMIPEINRTINGNQTKDENIADNGGLREALSAYRRYMKELIAGSEKALNPQDEQMPGIDLSPEQLLFLGFAQLWCAAYKEEHYWEELANEHTIDKYRVLGAVTNLEEFAQIYNCTLGSKMNPNDAKCRVW